MQLQDTHYRVCYADTDQMGVVYYGNYAKLFEIARGEAFRHLGMTYKAMEEAGVIMPVIEMNIKYHSSAFYDDLLTIKTRIKIFPTTRIQFEHEIYNENNKLLITGSVTLCFIDSKRMRPIKLPQEMATILQKMWKK